MEFPLEKFTRDPNILKYADPLKKIYRHLISENGWTFNQLIVQLKELIQEDENWVLNKIRSLNLNEPEVLNGLFLKIYDVNRATLHWPPLNYPDNPLETPLLVYVPGYHGESILEWTMRILHKIGLDMILGYNPTSQPPPFTPDLSDYPATHIFERAWLSDPYIRNAYSAIRTILLSSSINNNRVIHELLSGRSIEQNFGQKKIPLPANDNLIFLSYNHDGEIYEDTLCSNMGGNPARVYGPILSNASFESYYAFFDQRSGEIEANFATNSITSEKLTRKVTWDQQFFTIIGPNTNPMTDKYLILSLQYGGMEELPISDTAWIQVAIDTDESIDNTQFKRTNVIQGAFMRTFKPFLTLLKSGVIAISPYVSQMLEKNAKIREMFNAYNPILPMPDKKETNFRPLMSNLRRLRKTFKKKSWHFWGPNPSKLVNEFIEKYGHADTLLVKNDRIRNAATALQMHHTTANKDALIQALKDAIREYKPNPQSNKTNYRSYNSIIGELNTEMAKPWYAKTWGKSKSLIKKLLEQYLETFSDKGEANIVNALLELKALKSQAAIDKLHHLIESRRLRANMASEDRPIVTEPILRTPYRNALLKPVPMATPSVAPMATPSVAPLVAPLVAPSVTPLVASTNIRVPLTGTTTQVPLQSNGWTTATTRRGKPKIQEGGFTPTIMSSFATNGLRLLPAAGYMLYKNITRRKNKKKT